MNARILRCSLAVCVITSDTDLIKFLEQTSHLYTNKTVQEAVESLLKEVDNDDGEEEEGSDCRIHQIVLNKLLTTQEQNTTQANLQARKIVAKVRRCFRLLSA